jgi:hypothetical protein
MRVHQILLLLWFIWVVLWLGKQFSEHNRRKK